MEHKVLVVYNRGTDVSRVDEYVFSGHIPAGAITSHIVATRENEGLTNNWIYLDEFDRKFVNSSWVDGPPAATIPCIVFHPEFSEHGFERLEFINTIRAKAEEISNRETYIYDDVEKVFFNSHIKGML
ncbi:hypothetical protein GGI21_004125 [Coemansia aciculifera]|uniref:Uncharacterized protein n=1 Tax=Coemansia aciculifera TaxID=417176 RepID=A0ACC1M770_9FUNG|nr:hypothetical protein IWW38_001254 [Coemansia aciculifera]KAJ2905811.1 hypothetical protein GGI21_004125 [Coemansia aciculifera]